MTYEQTARTQTEKQEEGEKGEKLPSPRARKGLYEQPDDVERLVTYGRKSDPGAYPCVWSFLPLVALAIFCIHHAHPT